MYQKNLMLNQQILTLEFIYSFICVLGNKLTLETRPSKDGIDIREELLQFHSTYYSSNLMGLCVLGRGKTSSLTTLSSCSYVRQHKGTKNAKSLKRLELLNHVSTTIFALV